MIAPGTHAPWPRCAGAKPGLGKHDQRNGNLFSFFMYSLHEGAVCFPFNRTMGRITEGSSSFHPAIPPPRIAFRGTLADLWATPCQGNGTL
jgi:hypothetical protein